MPAVNTGSDEPGTPRRSPAIGAGSDELGVSRAETQLTEREGIFPLQVSVDGVSHVSCTSPEQECASLQPDVGVDDENETPTCTSGQTAAREEFARPSKKRQQPRMTAWGKHQTNLFDPGGYWDTPLLFIFTGVFSCVLSVLMSCLVRNFPK